MDDLEVTSRESTRVSLEADDQPEEVSATNADILKLRELHEQLSEGATHKAKRRKVMSVKKTQSNDNAVLDQSIFDVLENSEHGSDGSEESEQESDDDTPGWKIDVKKSNSRKM